VKRCLLEATLSPETTNEVVDRILYARALSQEIIRRAVLEDGDVGLFASDVLGYEVRPFHQQMLDWQDAHQENLILAPRGFGKSTICTVARVVFEVIRNPNIRILLVSNTQLQAEMFLRGIKSQFEQNELLRELFGDFVSSDKWDTREIVVSKRTSGWRESTVSCVGIGGPVASRHYDLILCDDLVDEDNARTEGQREKVKSWYYQTLMPCVAGEDSRIYVNGTRYHYGDQYGYLSKNDMAESTLVIPAIDADGSTPWPDRYSLDWLLEKKRKQGSIIFNAQYQNDTSLMKGNIFREEWFREYEVEPDWSKMRYVMGCDPAATRKDVLLSKDKASSDWWTIIGGAMPTGQLAEPVIYVRDIWRDRCTKDAYLRELKRYNALRKPIKVGIESVAAQEYLAQDAQKFMPVHRVERTTDKIARAYWLQAFFENGQVLFPAKSLCHDYSLVEALKDELLLFPEGEHDDLFDGLQTMVECALKFRRSGEGGSCSTRPMTERGVDDLWS